MVEKTPIIPLTTLLQSPQSYSGQELFVRGFLYQTADGRWMLAAEPALKSCCVGSFERSHQQMEVCGDMGNPQVGTVQVVQGKMEISSTRGLKLRDAVIQSDHSLSWGILWLVGLGIAFSLLMAWRRRGLSAPKSARL